MRKKGKAHEKHCFNIGVAVSFRLYVPFIGSTAPGAAARLCMRGSGRRRATTCMQAMDKNLH